MRSALLVTGLLWLIPPAGEASAGRLERVVLDVMNRGGNVWARANWRRRHEIDTGYVRGRRLLRFNSLDEARADVELVRTHEADVTMLGNWTAAQVVQHLAIVVAGSMDGMPEAPYWRLELP